MAAGNAPRAVVMGEAMRVAGIGSCSGVSADEVMTAVDAATRFGGDAALDALAVVPAKAGEPGIAEAARRLGLPLVVAEPAAESRLTTRSEASRSATGSACACEAAALGASGASARLAVPRQATGRVTCAIAETEEAQ